MQIIIDLPSLLHAPVSAAQSATCLRTHHLSSPEKNKHKQAHYATLLWDLKDDRGHRKY